MSNSTIYSSIERALNDKINSVINSTLSMSTYDMDSDGVVDNSQKLNNQSPSYYLDWVNFTSIPTTLSGYGITDAFDNSFISLIGKPTTIFDYGITDAFSGSFNDLTNKPTSLEGYGVVDGFTGTWDTLVNRPTLATVATTGNYNSLIDKPDLNHITYWSSIQDTPTTLAGYGITDGGSGSGSVSSMTAADILAKLLTVDGAASLLDADLLDGAEGALYARLASPTFTGTVILPATTSIGTVSSIEIGYVDGVTSAIQTQIGLKAPLASPTFTGTVTTPSLIVEDLTDGYVPYQKVADDKLSNSNIFYNGTNVGIGIGTPTEKLEVAGNMSMKSVGTSAYQNLGEIDWKNTGNTATNAKIWTRRGGGNYGSGQLIFETAPADAGTVERIRIDENGNVGIGTTAPGAKLEVYSNINANYVARFDQDHATGYGVVIDTDGTTTIPAFKINSGVGDNIFRVQQDGKVGIGTGAPSVSLEVAGTGIKSEIVQSVTAFTTGFFGNGYKVIETGGISSLEVDNLRVRGTLSAYELEINKISSVNGGLVISVANGTSYLVAGTTIYFDTKNGANPIQFKVGDYIKAQNWTGVSGEVITSYMGVITTVTQGDGALGNSLIVATTISGTAWNDMELVQVGGSDAARQNMIYLTAHDTNNPYIDGYAGVTDGDFTGHRKFRLGNLTGITDTVFGDLAGIYGLWSDSVYLTGGINATSGRIGGWHIDSTSIHDVAGTVGMSSAVTGGDDIRFWAGHATPASAPFKVTEAGVLTASSGTVGGWNLDTNVIYTGTKHIANGYSTSGITFASDGGIHAKRFYLNADGYVMVSGTDMTHLITKKVGTTVRNSHNAETSSSALTYETGLLKTITLTNGLLGAVTFKFDFRSEGGTYRVHARIYRNGVALGTEWNTISSAYATQSQNITQGWYAGDTCELRGYTENTIDAIYVRNFQIYYDDNPLVAVAYTNS